MSGVKDILQTGRFSILYRIYDNSGPHVLCINGIQQSMGMWQTFLSRFSEQYRIVLFDFPGQGKSRVLYGTPRLSLDEQIQILKAVADKAGVNTGATLCSASWGGVVAVDFASRYPRRIKRLILASLGTKPNARMRQTIEMGSGVDRRDREGMARILIESFGAELPAHFKQKIINQFQNMTEENLRAFCEHGLFVISSKKLSEIVDLKNIRAKTILLNGENDTIIDLEDVRALASQIPGCELRIIKGVGHFLHMECEDVLDVYEDVLALV